MAADIQCFLGNEPTLAKESLTLISTALLPAYGSENYGLFDGEIGAKADLLTWLNNRFPGHPELGFRLADCKLMLGETVESWYPLLRKAMLEDKARRNYPTAEIFEALAGSAYSFDFDMILLEQYYQPCSEAAFEDYRNDFLAEYQEAVQQRRIRGLRWKGTERDGLRS